MGQYLVGGHPATNAQIEAINMGLLGQDMVIEAGAGSGKTTLLAALSGYRGGKGLYISFNKAIADEASEIFPRTVKCTTAHSLAYRAVGKTYRRRLKRRLSGGIVAKQFNLTEAEHISAFAQGNIAIATVNRYCYSADTDIDIQHVPKSELVKIEDLVLREFIVQEAVTNAQLVWREMNKKTGRIPVTHDFYLKKWALSEPDLGFDFILMDESQDTNDVLINLLEKQTAQKIWVGDHHQSIYAWRGAVNAMSKISIDNATRIEQSFRFGPAIAEVANAILEKHVDTDMRLTGFDSVDSELAALSQPDAIICRTNAEAMRYMVEAVKKGIRATFAGGIADLTRQVSALKTLSTRGSTNHIDFAAFQSFTEFNRFAFSKEGGEFKPLALMIKEYGFGPLQDILKQIKDVEEGDAELVICTAHKAKGLEWDNVKLGSDFKSPDDKAYSKSEGNLLYVAVTRAKRKLDITECKAAQQALGKDACQGMRPEPLKAAYSLIVTKPGREATVHHSETLKKTETLKKVKSTSVKKVASHDAALQSAMDTYQALTRYLSDNGIDVKALQEAALSG